MQQAKQNFQHPTDALSELLNLSEFEVEDESDNRAYAHPTGYHFCSITHCLIYTILALIVCVLK